MNMKQITLEVQGMSCGHCVKSIEDNVGNLSGVTSVKVHLDTSKVDLEFDESIISLEEIKNEIEEQGYDVAA